MRKFTKSAWALVALLVAVVLAWPIITAALKVVLVIIVAALPIAVVVFIFRRFTGGSNRLIR